MSSRQPAAIAIVLVLALAACGEGTDVAAEAPGPTGATTTTVAPSTTTEVTHRATSTTRRPAATTTVTGIVAPAEEVAGPSPLTRKDIAPGGVADQFSVGTLAAVTGCAAFTGDKDLGKLQIGDAITLCVGRTAFEGWTWRLRFPDGRSETLEGPVWEARLGDPTGAYRLTAAQGSESVTATFEVVLRSEPTILPGEPYRGPAGTRFVLGLAGFGHHNRLQPDLYRFVGREGAVQHYEFLTALAPVRPDDRGEARVAIASQPGDPAGQYCVTVRGVDVRSTAVNKCPSFTVAVP